MLAWRHAYQAPRRGHHYTAHAPAPCHPRCPPRSFLVGESQDALYVSFMGTKLPRDMATNANLFMEEVFLDAAMLSSGSSADFEDGGCGGGGGGGGSGVGAAGGRTLAAHRGFLARSRSIPIQSLYQEARSRGKRLVLCGEPLARGPACGTPSLLAVAACRGRRLPQLLLLTAGGMGARMEMPHRPHHATAVFCVQATAWAAPSPRSAPSSCCSTCPPTCTTPSGAPPACLPVLPCTTGRLDSLAAQFMPLIIVCPSHWQGPSPPLPLSPLAPHPLPLTLPLVLPAAAMALPPLPWATRPWPPQW